MRRTLRGLFALLVWAAVAVPAWAVLVTHSSAHVQVAGHESVVRPTLGGWTVLRTGALLPDARMPSGHWMGADIELGKTEVATVPEMISRYAALAARPEGEITRLSGAVEDMAVTAAARAAVIGGAPLLLWFALGRRRRRELLAPRTHHLVIASMTATALVVVLAAPWRVSSGSTAPAKWEPLSQALPAVAIPVEFAGVELQGNPVSRATTRLVESAFDTYANSKGFYEDVLTRVREAADRLRTPEEGDTVGILISDRHDNVGMDPVAATIGREAGATVVLDAGDDTSTGASWEAFSLDSLDEAFADYPHRVFVTGNHDNGKFVGEQLQRMGWTSLSGSPVSLFGGITLTGVDDPRSSGLGNWRDETGLGFAGVRDRFSTELCRLNSTGERVDTVLVHDANLVKPAWERGCVDLVVGGHLHSPSGPTIARGDDGVGYSYTNGTTGGAAYAFAMGSKLRREAMVTLITWRQDRAFGIQPVTVRTTGEVDVGSFVRMGY